MLTSFEKLVPAWYASPQPVWDDQSLFPNYLLPLANAALRQRVRIGYGGTRPRLLLSNAHGSAAVEVAEIQVAPSLDMTTIDAARSRRATFGGETSCILAPGATILSDPIAMDVFPGAVLALTMRFNAEPAIATFHWEGRSTAQLIAATDIREARPQVRATSTARVLITGILVEAASLGTVVALGDSITDGAGASLDTNLRWPDLLADRLAPRGLAVLNAGISGARLLRDGMGINALARFDRDVLAQPDVRAVILKLGTNDLGFASTQYDPLPPPSLAAMTQAYRLIIERAHTAGVQVIGGTLAPFAGALPGTPFEQGYHTARKELLRRTLNQWIARSGAFDGVVDFATLLADPLAPDRLAPLYDSGDHLHPNDEGNAAMAAAVEAKLLEMAPLKPFTSIRFSACRA